jgi:3-aminobutyryl-CoA ammonia-lyase
MPHIPEDTPVVHTVNPDGLPRPSGYSHAAVAGPLVSVAGQLPAGEAMTGSFPAQFESALVAVVRVLEACGGAPADILHLRIFVTDLAAYTASRAELRDPFKRCLQGHYPATTLVEVSGLMGGALVEIEALAARPTPGERASGVRDEPPAAGPVARLRLRLAPSDARYAGGLVPGSKAMEIFADLETELSLLEGGDEGLCASYDMVEFLAPLRVGDFVEATAHVVSRGRSSRRIYAEVHKVLSVDEVGRNSSPPEPVLAARASATIVVGRSAAG